MKKFVVVALDLKYKVIIIYIVALNICSNISDNIYPLKIAQIAYLKANKAFIEVFSNYTNFANIFSPKLAIKLPKYRGINDYAIELVDN